MLLPGVEANERYTVSLFFVSPPSGSLLRFHLYSVSVVFLFWLILEKILLFPGIISCVASLCCVCSPEKRPCPPAALGHKTSSFSFQVACRLLLSEYGDNLLLKTSQAARLGALGICNTGDQAPPIRIWFLMGRSPSVRTVSL